MKRWRRVLEALVFCALLYFIGAYLAAHWREVRSYPWEIAPLPLGAASLLAGLALAAFGALWTGLVRAAGEEIGLRAALPIWFLSNLARYVPGKVWQISGMAYLARRRGVRAVHAVGASLLLQMLVLATGILLLIAFLPAETVSLYGRGVEIGLTLGALGMVALYLSPLFDLLHARAASWLGQPVPPELLTLRQKLAFGAGTAAAWVLYGASFWLFVAGTAGRTPPPVATGAIFVAGYLAGFLALFTPGGLGVREGVTALLLGSYLPASVALAVALLCRVWLTLLELALAGLSAAFAGQAERTEQPRPAIADEQARCLGRDHVDTGMRSDD